MGREPRRCASLWSSKHCNNPCIYHPGLACCPVKAQDQPRRRRLTHSFLSNPSAQVCMASPELPHMHLSLAGIGFSYFCYAVSVATGQLHRSAACCHTTLVCIYLIRMNVLASHHRAVPITITSFPGTHNTSVFPNSNMQQTWLFSFGCIQVDLPTSNRFTASLQAQHICEIHSVLWYLLPSC